MTGSEISTMADFQHQELKKRLIRCLSDLIVSREEQVKFLEDFIEEVETQEIVVNTAKTAATAGTVASTVALFFPPTAVFGVIGLVASGVASVSTSVGDLIANRLKSGKLKEMMEKSKDEEKKLENTRNEMMNAITKVQKMLNVDAHVAQELILNLGYEGTIALAKDLAKGGTVIATEVATKVAAAVPHLARMGEAVRFGYGILDAAFYAGGTTVELVVEGGQAFYQITGAAVGTLAKSLAGVASVIGVADVIYSWANDNPNLASAKKCLEHIKSSLESLEEYKNGLEQRQTRR